ncbi:Sec23/Sec24 trunk domain-containing protein [Phycomyces blakesleeanus]
MNTGQRPPPGPIRPQTQPTAGIRPPGHLPPMRPMNAVPGTPMRPMMNPAGAPQPPRPMMPVRPGVPAPVRPLSGNAPATHPQFRPSTNTPLGPNIRPAAELGNTRGPADLVAPMQTMQLQPTSPLQPAQVIPQGRTKRVYVNPDVAAGGSPIPPNPQSAPWPHGLNQQQQQQQQQQHPNFPQHQLPPHLQQQQQQQFTPAGVRPPLAPPVPHAGTNAPGSAGIGYHNGPYTNSQQQLPPDLRPPQQPRPRVDPNQMPSPVQVREHDEELFSEKFFGTLERDKVPLATTPYIGLDQGNANPRFIRSTVDRVPYSKDLADTSKLPMGLVIQPLAKPRPDEVAIQTVDHGEEGPIRCSRCRAYINPFSTFIQGGGRYACNICSHSNEVPSWYFANLDMSGRRIDVDQRPELRYGSVEFEVPPDYNSARKPVPLHYVFAIDVSMQSVQSGTLKACCEALSQALYSPTNGQSTFVPGNKIGILTFDKGVQFYNLSPSLSQAQMIVVSDINDMFLPLQDGFLVDPYEAKDLVLELLKNIPVMFKDNIKPESVYTSSVRGGMLALEKTGGHLYVFQSTLPTFGPDALKSRDDKALYNTDKEKPLLNPQSEAYTNLGKECVKNGVCVHSWLFAFQYIDVATLGIVSELTGGDVRYYPKFATHETKKLAFQLSHDLHRESGYDAVLRIRCSDGLQVVDHYGNFHMSTYTDMELAGIDEDKAVAAVFKHDSKLDLDRGVSFQCAMLYTTKDGHRRVRVHTLSIPVTSQIVDVFRCGDEDATISVMLRKAIFDLHHKSRKTVHQMLTDACVQVLTTYRTKCAASTSPGQLILPEGFKLLPIHVHAAIRSAALRGVGADMNADARSAGMTMFNGMGVKEFVLTLYPRMYALHNLTDQSGTQDLRGDVKLPPMVRCSYERLDSHGAYILDTGSDLFIWLGKNIPSSFLEDVFGVSHLEQVDSNMSSLPAFTTELSHKVHALARQFQSERSRYLELRVVRQDMDPLEFIFSTWMAEDRNAEVQTYVDFMCVLHRKIQDEMKKSNNY